MTNHPSKKMKAQRFKDKFADKADGENVKLTKGEAKLASNFLVFSYIIFTHNSFR